jgi:hypothetical protein
MAACRICRALTCVRAMHRAGVWKRVAMSSPTRFLEAKSAGKGEFSTCLKALYAGDDVEGGKPDPIDGCAVHPWVSCIHAIVFGHVSEFQQG